MRILFIRIGTDPLSTAISIESKILVVVVVRIAGQVQVSVTLRLIQGK